jgi:hypothetical protein
VSPDNLPATQSSRSATPSHRLCRVQNGPSTLGSQHEKDAFEKAAHTATDEAMPPCLIGWSRGSVRAARRSFREQPIRGMRDAR